MLLTMGVALYTSRVVLNVLGVEDFGIYNVVGGVVTMFAFLNGAMSASTSRFITIELGKGDYKQLQKVFSTTVINHVFIALLILILAETIGLWFVLHKLVIPEARMSAALWVYQFSVFTCIVSLMQTPYNAAIIAHERMNIYAWGGIVDSVLKLAILFVLGLFSFDKLKFYSVLIFIVVGLISTFYYLYVRYSFNYCSFQPQKDIELYKKLFSYSGWDLIGNFSSVAQGQGLNILLNMFFGAAVNAARGITYQIQGAVTQFGGNFMTAVRPQIIKYYATGEKEKMIDLVFSSAKYSFFLIWILVLPIFLETEYILTLWLKIVPPYTVQFTRIVLLITLVNAFRTPIVISMHATGRIKIPNIVCGSILISTLPISYLFLKLGFNPTSVFIISLFVTVVNWAVELILIKRIVGYSIRLFLKKILLTCVIVALCSLLLPYFVSVSLPPDFGRLLIVFVLCMMSISLFVYTIGIDSSMRISMKNKLKCIIFKNKIS